MITALCIAVAGLVLAALGWPPVLVIVLMKVLGARQAAQEAAPELPPAPDRPPGPAASGGQQDDSRVFDPKAKRVTNQHGQLVGRKRLAELAAESGKETAS